MRQGLRLALKDLTDHLPVVVYRYQLLAGHRPHMLYISEAVERLTGSTAQAVMDNCRIPDDCIDKNRYPLFMARSVLRELIESLPSTRSL